MRILLYTVIALLFFMASCTQIDNNYYLTTEEPSATTVPYVQPSVDFAPLEFQSEADLFEVLSLSKAYSTKGESAFDSTVNEDMQRAAITGTRRYFTDKLNYIYRPSWVPEQATLHKISVTDFSVAYWFILNDMPDSKVSEYNDRSAEELVNIVIFEWPRYEDGMKTLEQDIGNMALCELPENKNVYYCDIRHPSNDSVTLSRDFFWIQDGYAFHYNIPLSALEGVKLDFSSLAVKVEVK